MKVPGLFLFLTALVICGGCKNPFAPDIEFGVLSGSASISDLRQPQGIFQNVQYAYSFKDTLIYGELIHEDFVFSYRDYDLGFDVSWGRLEEMHITHGLFQNSERLDLIWNNILYSSITDTSTSGTIIRSFNLTITFNPSDIVSVTGKANLQLQKNPLTEKWQIKRWVDESNF